MAQPASRESILALAAKLLREELEGETSPIPEPQASPGKAAPLQGTDAVQRSQPEC